MKQVHLVKKTVKVSITYSLDDGTPLGCAKSILRETRMFVQEGSKLYADLFPASPSDTPTNG